jgi:hypothetical protein
MKTRYLLFCVIAYGVRVQVLVIVLVIVRPLVVVQANAKDVFKVHKCILETSQPLGDPLVGPKLPISLPKMTELGRVRGMHFSSLTYDIANS